ncbi:MAG: PKD domain-containing protein, partial [Candidatus Tectomicrobia bacterium]|nr:PKD domain-containing protein [Candidatus Tectomicrobia bacterium]
SSSSRHLLADGVTYQFKHLVIEAGPPFGETLVIVKRGYTNALKADEFIQQPGPDNVFFFGSVMSVMQGAHLTLVSPSGATLTLNGAIGLEDGATLNLQSDAIRVGGPINGPLSTATSVGTTINVTELTPGAGTFTLSGAGSGTGIIAASRINVETTTVTITSTGVLSADARGFGSESGPGAGGRGFAFFIGGQGGGGGGYGGRGGAGAIGGNNGGLPYGDPANPVDLGSGGGAGSGSGGSGGGIIKLEVSGTTIDGLISSNGGAGGAGPFGIVSVGAGGGSGGSILIRSGGLAGRGTIQANGGAGSSSNAGIHFVSDGGGGACGRIEVSSSSNTGTVRIERLGGPGGFGSYGAEAGGCDQDEGNRPPIANAGPDQVVEAMSPAGASVALDGTGSSDPDGDPLTFVWSESGIDIATGRTPTVNLSFGVHQITLTVTDPDRASSTDTVQITVGDTTPPNVNAGEDQTVNEGATVSFSGSFSDAVTTTVNDPSQIVWDFGDGTTTTGTLTPTHTYPENGMFNVTLTVRDNNGNVGSDTLIVTVNNVAPMVSITSIISPSPLFILPGLLLTFNGKFTDPGVLDTQVLRWNFGDGTTSGDIAFPAGGSGNSTVTHAYASAGTFTVILSVTDDDGGVGTATATVEVKSHCQAINDDLRSLIQSLPLNSGQKNSLISKLRASCSSIESGDLAPACNQLVAFIREVNAFVQSGRLDAGTGNLLVSAAEALQTSLGCR